MARAIAHITMVMAVNMVQMVMPMPFLSLACAADPTPLQGYDRPAPRAANKPVTLVTRL